MIDTITVTMIPALSIFLYWLLAFPFALLLSPVRTVEAAAVPVTKRKSGKNLSHFQNHESFFVPKSFPNERKDPAGYKFIISNGTDNSPNAAPLRRNGRTTDSVVLRNAPAVLGPVIQEPNETGKRKHGVRKTKQARKFDPNDQLEQEQQERARKRFKQNPRNEPLFERPITQQHCNSNSNSWCLQKNSSTFPKQQRKWLVLDMDETLIHSCTNLSTPMNMDDFLVTVGSSWNLTTRYVLKRPGVDRFLYEMNKHYNIAVFTAGTKEYADQVLDVIDTNRVIQRRLYRDSCTPWYGSYVKDLSKHFSNLHQTIIVDNSPGAYAWHQSNAIACSSFVGDRSDRQLEAIEAFLIAIRDTPDVRNECCRWVPPPVNLFW